VASSSVDRASFVSDFVVGHPLESVVSLSTMATIITTARNENLRSDVDIWPSSLSSDLDSIGKGRGGSMSPARSTVRWNMLVSQVGQIVGSLNRVPDPLLWKIINRLKRVDDVSWLWESVGDSARSVLANFSAGLDTSTEQKCDSVVFHDI